MKKTIVITGASSGIGKAMAHRFAQEGYNLFLIARRVDLLKMIQKDVENAHPVEVQIFQADLTILSEMYGTYDAFIKHDVFALINNAGFGDFSYPWDIDIKKASKMIDLNVKALAMLSMLFIRDYADRESILLNVSSLGGYCMFDVSVMYCATKFFVSAFTEGLAVSLKSKGKKMRAKVLAPGPTSSEFFIKASENASLDPEKLFGDSFALLSTKRLADYAYELLFSDNDVGLVNQQNQLEMKQPVFQHFEQE